MLRWIGGGLMVLALAGCPESRTLHVADEPVVARDYIGNAFVAAARAHKAVVQEEYNPARNAVIDLRRQLRLADRRADAEQRRTIAELERLAIALEGTLQAQSPASVGRSKQLMHAFFGYYDALSAPD